MRMATCLRWCLNKQCFAGNSVLPINFQRQLKRLPGIFFEFNLPADEDPCPDGPSQAVLRGLPGLHRHAKRAELLSHLPKVSWTGARI